MIIGSKKTTWITGIAILVLTNVVALAGVVYNRSGEPVGTLRLSERELRLPNSNGFGRENSGLSLTVKWRILSTKYNEHSYANQWSAAEWLDEDKLDELGFKVEGATLTMESRYRFNRAPSRLVWLVLEYDGAAYQEMRKRSEAFLDKSLELADRNPESEDFRKRADNAMERRDEEEVRESRLFVVNAGLDRSVLEKKYPDNTRYILQRGSVRASLRQNEVKQWIVQGFIHDLAVETVNVPLKFCDLFDDASGFLVTLAYGKRHEPWIVAVENRKR